MSPTTAQFGEFRKSRRSGNGPNCVQVAFATSTDQNALRDSKNPDAGDLVFTGRAFRAFTARIRKNPLD